MLIKKCIVARYNLLGENERIKEYIMELSVIFNPDEFLLDTLLLFLVLSVEIVNVHNVDTQIYL